MNRLMLRFLQSALTVLCLALLFGCSANRVQVTQDQQQPIDSDSGRYTNLYPGEKDYPFTCTENCYQPRQEIHCRPEQGCQYQGTLGAAEFEQGFRVQWLGHAFFLITTPSGETLATDPVLQEFDWPINWLHAWFNGNYRLRYPTPQGGFDAIEGVLYSHVHYDHFSRASVSDLPDNVRYFTPLGMSRHFPDAGLSVNELGWFSQTTLGQSVITAVPAHHFSSRVLVPYLYEDENAVSWSGWVVESQGQTLFYAGDTGYSAHFKDIGQRYGGMDICLLPIASYHSEAHPKWYRYVHMTPEDALMAAKDLSCKTVIPWGYGNASWGMGDKSSHAPLTRFLNVLDNVQHGADIVILDELSQ
ncbi:MBL fold metallo-hydrolase [Aestuariibacter halophilus]|uniref:MBL fold metallo-hydrolase n=1 Tax=Fluctibacter halophilus TaxID=226011 RepID=A0ABS8G864_9ALTE|nr:MBL fold metallo-hydrolase [Aestuariibacter halophilus]MCC2616762.1 MBL fold metallo-hydrolase [Aestuariibacter halophilus]